MYVVLTNKSTPRTRRLSLIKFNSLLPVALVTSLAFLAPSVAKAQLSDKDQAFLREIESYAEERGTTFSDVSDQTNIETAQKLCTGIQNQGLSTAFEKFIGKAKANEEVTEGEAEALGYMFGKSVEYYCPQYSDDLNQYLQSL